MEAASSSTLAAALALLMVAVPLANATAANADPTGTALDATEPTFVSEPLPRGDVEPTGEVTFTPPAPIAVDGSLHDWQGQATRLGGTTVLDAGELVYQGFAFDDHGADDGKDAERLETLGPAYEANRRTERIEALAQAADEQFGAPDPTDGVLVSPAHYGNADLPGDRQGHADLLETRLTAREETAYIAARTASMTDSGALALLVLADTEPGPTDEARAVPFDSGITTTEADRAFLVTAEGVWQADLAEGTTQPLASVDVAADASGYANAIEAALPLQAIAADADGDSELALAVGAGLHAGDGTLVDVATGEAEANVVDVAFRHEDHVSNWMDRDQALSLLEGDMDTFARVPVQDLQTGKSLAWQPTPGYHERLFESSTNISQESDREGLVQHYGLYLPSDWEPGEEHPLTFWLHWRGGTAHQAAAWTPRAVEQLGEEREPSNVVVSPRGRGTSTWYAGAGHLDVLQVYEDVHETLAIDEDRRYLSGYSMGGYGSYLFGLLYPDQFAAAYPISGAMTIGLWAGIAEDGTDTQGANGGDGNLENTYRLVENARNLPYVIHHGTNDELVPVTGVQRMAATFADHGYEYRFYRFPGYEHFTQAIVDQWTEGADYLDRHVRDETPPEVTYKRVPALETAIETLNQREADIDLDTDGAYWVDDVQLRAVDTTDPTVHGQVDARSHAIPNRAVTTPEAGAASPSHDTPYVMDGLAHTPVACESDVVCPLVDPVANRLTVDLANVASASVHAEDARLDTTDTPLAVELATDGSATLTLAGDWTCTDGQHDSPANVALTVEPDAVTIDATQAGSYTVHVCV
jgi:poly(3-hydroxybutyrate) depolymerase